MCKQIIIFFAICSVFGGCTVSEANEKFLERMEDVESEEGKTEAVEITYIANEGVLISHGDEQVLIDALHKPYRPEFLPTPPEVEASIMEQVAPFNSIDVYLVSHIHRDHLDAQTVAQFMDLQPEVQLFSSSQVLDSVNTYRGVESNKANVTEVPFEDGTSVTYERDGITIIAGKVAHGSSARFSRIHNLGHLIYMGGKSVLHMGDPAYGRDDIAQLLKDHETIDVALIPSWFISSYEGRAVIDEVIRPKKIVVVHVTPSDFENAKQEVKTHYPEAHVFGTPMEKLSF